MNSNDRLFELHDTTNVTGKKFTTKILVYFLYVLLREE